MPRVAEFFGIVVSMYFDDHNPPHFHASYADDEALIVIGSLDVLAGRLPGPKLKQVKAWAAANEQLLRDKWEELHE